MVSYTPPAHRWNISNEIFMNIKWTDCFHSIVDLCCLTTWRKISPEWEPSLASMAAKHCRSNSNMCPARGLERDSSLCPQTWLGNPPKKIDRLMRKSSKNEKIHGGVLQYISTPTVFFIQWWLSVQEVCVFSNVFEVFFNPGFIEWYS